MSEACKLAGTAMAGDGTPAAVRLASPSLSASKTAFVIFSTNSGMPSVRSMTVTGRWGSSEMPWDMSAATKLMSPLCLEPVPLISCFMISWWPRQLRVTGELVAPKLEIWTVPK